MTPFEHKLHAQLQALAAAGHSRASAAVEMGVAVQTLRNWLALVDPDRQIVFGGQRPPRQRRKLPELLRPEPVVSDPRKVRPAKPLSAVELKLRDEIEELAGQGHSRQAVADELGIHSRTLRRWLERLDPNGRIVWPAPGQSRRQRHHQQRIRLRVVAVGRRKG